MSTRLADRVVTALRASDGLSRADLSELLGAPPNAVAAAVAGLLGSATIVSEIAGAPAGVAVESAAAPGRRRGRPTSVLRLAGPQRVVAVVTASVAGPRVALVTPGGRVLGHAALPVAEPGSRDSLAVVVRAAVRAATDPALHTASALTESGLTESGLTESGLTESGLTESGLSGSGLALEHVVLSVPAPFGSGPGLAERSPGAPGYDSLVDGDPTPALARELGVGVTAENDANLAALGEASAGAGRGHPDLVQLTLDGYSVGAGLVIGGRLHRGASGFGGELAHIHIDDDGPLCACGARGCLTRRLGRPLFDAIAQAWGTPVSWAEVLDRAAAGDSSAQRVLADIGRLIGRPLADLCTVLNPSLIIVDSRLRGGGPWVAGGIREQVDRYAAPGAARALEIVAGELDDAVGVGAARLVRDQLMSAVTARTG